MAEHQTTNAVMRLHQNSRVQQMLDAFHLMPLRHAAEADEDNPGEGLWVGGCDSGRLLDGSPAALGICWPYQRSADDV